MYEKMEGLEQDIFTFNQGTLIHFSVDDTIAVFENLTKEEYSSCFDEPVLGFFKSLNEQYGLKVTMYCFYEKSKGFSLKDGTEKFREEFRQNSHWLKFGFHGRNCDSKYNEYEKDEFIRETELVYENLERMVSPEAISYNVRLGFATGNMECVNAFKQKYPKFQTLYGAEDKRIEYYLSKEENDVLLEQGSFFESKVGITIVLSELRLEMQQDMPSYLKRLQSRDGYAFFTHEQCFGDDAQRERVKRNLTFLCETGTTFTF